MLPPPAPPLLPATPRSTFIKSIATLQPLLTYTRLVRLGYASPATLLHPHNASHPIALPGALEKQLLGQRLDFYFRIVSS